MDLKSAFSKANNITPTKSATTLPPGEYFRVDKMERKTTRFGDQVLVTFTTGQKVWLPNSFSRELRDDILATVRPGQWELCFLGMTLLGSRFTKARFDVRPVIPASSQPPDWANDGNLTPLSGLDELGDKFPDDILKNDSQ